MSIGAIGASGSGTLNQILASLLSRIDNSKDSSTSSGQPADSSFAPDAGSAPCNALTGSTTASLSGDVLGVLIGLQQQSGASQTSASDQTSAGPSSPLDRLFSAMDSNGDGSVSQTEMETYLEQQGATQSQADGSYAMLDQNGSNGVGESQMADALQQSGAVHRGGGGHHHHHRGASGASSSDGADALLQAMDANDDGAVTQSEFTDFVTQNGGTADEASKDFAALDTSGSGTLGPSDFASAIEQLQSSMNNGTYSPVLSFLDAFAQNTTATGTTSVTA